MSDTMYFGDYVVEHEDWNLSYVYHHGVLIKKFAGKEDSWAAAERYASDKYFQEMFQK